MTIATVASASRPMSEINTTPLIDVMLVLLIMIIMTIPVSTHSLDYDLPQPDQETTAPLDRLKNRLVLTASGRLEWNNVPVSERQLTALLLNVRATDPEPEVQFEPEANVSYERSARVLQIVKASHVTRFGFVGNEKYRVFGRGT
jgi:biopolymer transport protein ExbD